MRVNERLDRLPRTRFGRATEVPVFRTCGVAGYYLAVVITLGAGVLTGRSPLVLAVLCAVCGLSFFVYAFARRLAGGERLILLEHVWFAELCSAGLLWALALPLLTYLDLISIGLCFFLAAGRVGCLLVGCCHGRPSSVGIRYGEEAVRDGFPHHLVGVRLLPVPALEATALLAIGAVGLAALPTAPAGAVFTWFLVAYSVVRFGLEGLRGDRRQHLLGLSVNRWMCVAELSCALVLWTHEHGGLGRRELVLLATLAALLVATVAGRALLDPRRRLFGDRHIEELRRDRGANGPRARITSGGIIVAHSLAADRMPLSCVSLSRANGTSDLQTLCELAARAFPTAVVESAVVSDAGVLHLLVADVSASAVDPDCLAAALLGAALPRTEAQAASAPRDGTGPAVRAAYFGG